VILLDTHAWLWLAGDKSQLSRRALSRIRNATKLAVCTISIWEIAMLVGRGRLRFDRDLADWFGQATSIENLEMVPLSPTIGMKLAEMGGDFHGDPADRIIAATALTLGVELVTQDEKMNAFEPLRCIR
jgi:PIN domain nuclease of toxin-antitoxin system